MNLLHRWQHYFSNLSVRRKLNLLTLLIALGVIALSVIAARMQYLDLTETRKTALKTQVELSYGILQHYHRLAGTGGLSEEAAKSAALQALEVMRAENDTYYFNIYDTGYRLLMHPFRKDLVGKDMKDFRTDDGVRIYYDQVEAARAGGASSTTAGPSQAARATSRRSPMPACSRPGTGWSAAASTWTTCRSRRWCSLPSWPSPVACWY